MPLELMHYAATPTVLDRNRTYQQDPGLKPRGLWVSVRGVNDWPSWCRSEEFDLDRLTHEHAVTLTTVANILWVDTYKAVRGLTGRYPAAPYPPIDRVPDWRSVAAEYDGIIIAPYQWEARWGSDTFWYYGWDCASGCIWNLDAITAFTLVNERGSARAGVDQGAPS